jgi:hypothetical protein
LIARTSEPSKKDGLILRVVEHVGDLIGEESNVDRMEDGPDHGNREVQLQVAVPVPRERGDAISRVDAEPAERMREPRDPLRELHVGEVNDLRAVARDDLFARVRAHGMIEDVAYRQGPIGHGRVQKHAEFSLAKAFVAALRK